MNDTTPLSIFIVDDEKTNLDVLNHILSDEYDVFIAKSGTAALKLIAANQPDLVLLDIIMPDLNGFEVLARLKANPETSRIPVIFITGLDDAAYEERGLQAGAVDYIAKPFSAAVVKARVRTQMKIIEQVRAIESLGMVDPLTGLPNRNRFDLQLRVQWLQAIRKKTTISLLTIEPDRFSDYAAQAGPSGTDHFIRHLAALLRSVAESLNGFVARLDGATFQLFLTDTDESQASILADEIKKKARSIPVSLGLTSDWIFRIGVISMQPTLENSLEELRAQGSNSLPWPDRPIP